MELGMNAFIRNPKTWVIEETFPVISYDLPLECREGETGTISLAGKPKADYNRHILSLEGNNDDVWKITSLEQGSETNTVLKVEDALSCIEHPIRSVRYYSTGYPQNMTGQLFQSVFGDLTVSQVSGGLTRDTNSYKKYDLGGNFAPTYVGYIDNRGNFTAWLNALNLPTGDYEITSHLSAIGFTHVAIDSDKLLRDIASLGTTVKIGKAQSTSQGSASSHGDTLKITFGLGWKRGTVENIVFNDGHTFLISEKYDNSVVSRFIGTKNPTSSNTTVVYNVYLNASMQATTTASEQIQGETATGTVTASNYIAKAEEEFAKNTWSHKVEFASDKEFHLGQPVRLVLDRGILDTAISKVSIKSGDDRFFYSCGDIPITATEQIKSNSWSYGRRLPLNPYKGQLVFI